jgi:hypothetical protein
MHSVIHSVMMRTIKAEIAECESESLFLEKELQSSAITDEWRRKASKQQALLQSRILSLVNEIEELQKGYPRRQLYPDLRLVP